MLVPAATAAAADDGPESVVVADRLGERDWVEVVFPAATPYEEAEARVRRAVEAAGLRIGGIRRDDDRDDVLELDVGTIVGERTGFLERSIEGDVLRALDVFANGRVTVEVPRAASVDGGVPEVETALSHRTLAPRPLADVSYRVPIWRALLPVAVVLAFLSLPYLAMRAWARRIERGDEPAVDKLHRLRVAGAAGLGLMLLAAPAWLVGGVIELPEMILSEIAPSATRGGLVRALAVALLLVLAWSPLVAGALALAPAYRRIRGIEANRRESRRKVLRAGVFLLLPLVWFGAIQALRLTGVESGGRMLALLVMLVVFVVVVGPLTALIAFDTERADPELRRRLRDLCERHGLRVRDVRIIRGRWNRTANAAIVGIIPPLRYVLVSDHLLETFADDEVEAVVAHEVGHGKGHHLLVRLVAWIVLGAIPAALVIGLLEALDVPALIFAFAVPLVYAAAFFAVFATLSLLHEKRADAFAARAVGKDATRRALARLAEVNQMKHRTGLLMNLLSLHPSIEQRLAALDDDGGGATPGRAAST